jgi:hypothetical protein
MFDCKANITPKCEKMNSGATILPLPLFLCNPELSTCPESGT